MAKRALLIGCNYPGTEAELQGCVNDVFRMKALYEECFGIEDFTILVDTDDKYLKPTGKQIKESLRKIVQNTESEDVFVLHFSGHGTQVPTDDPTEEDMLDEALVPTDMNLLLDDDLRDILKELPHGAYLTFVSDCCHSGGMLDHEEIQITGPKDPKSRFSFDMSSIFSAFGLRELGVPLDGVKNRSLPADQLMRMLGVQAGDEVNTQNVRSMLTDFFGEDASSKIFQYVTALHDMMDVQGKFAKFKKMLMSPFKSSFKKNEEQDKFEWLKPGHKPPPEGQLSQDVGVLITGCQSHETSADACPGGLPENAYGALSNAIQTVVREHYKHSEGMGISNKDLVFAVRKLLADGSYKQNPCLECSEQNAERCFITGSALSED